MVGIAFGMVLLVVVVLFFILLAVFFRGFSVGGSTSDEPAVKEGQGLEGVWADLQVPEAKAGTDSVPITGLIGNGTDGETTVVEVRSSACGAVSFASAALVIAPGGAIDLGAVDALCEGVSLDLTGGDKVEITIDTEPAGSIQTALVVTES